MRVKCNPHALVVGALIGAAGIATSQAASTFITFSVDMSTNLALGTFNPPPGGADVVEAHGTFNGYGALTLVQQGSSTVYTNTANDTTDANGGKLQWKYVINGGTWENTATGNDRAVRLPATSGASLVLPTAYFNDAGPNTTNLVTFRVDMAQQINLGAFIPGTHTVNARGGFNGWGITLLTNDPSIFTTNQFGLVNSDVYVGIIEVAGSPASAQAFKYFYNNGADQWDGPSTVNQNGGGNRYYDNVPQVLPIVYFSDAPYAPIATNEVTFQVDMSAQALTGAFVDGMPIDIRGSFNNWTGGANPLTNNPSAPNTNIYSAVIIITNGVGAVEHYKFTYTGNSGVNWESPASTGGGDRTFTQPNATSTLVPVVYFNDLALNDLLPQDMLVTFKVDMNGAVGTDSHSFNSTADRVFLNGQFIPWYAWWDNGNPQPAPAQFEMLETPVGSGIYSNTVTIPKGTSVGFSYKYGMGIAGAPGPSDNEAASGNNHFRVVRTTQSGTYEMPMDKFSLAPYLEPQFGNLSIGAPVAGQVSVTWLGRPGLHLQSSASLTGGIWQDYLLTDGTNMTTGYSSTNGFVSQTNWPATGSAFFRLIKP